MTTRVLLVLMLLVAVVGVLRQEAALNALEVQVSALEQRVAAAQP
jgi:hypothetical protein